MFAQQRIIARLSKDGIALNVTAILTVDQVHIVSEALDVNTPAVVSVFAGRIADTGVDPVPIMEQSLKLLKHLPKAELLWASCRELLNILHAEQAKSHIITVPHAMLQKLDLIGKNLDNYSLDTVRMFYKDAQASAYTIRITEAAIS